MPKSENCQCGACGFEWKRGLDGSHSCSAQLGKTIELLEARLVLVSKLAADTPMFNNPLHAFEAAKIRDQVLSGLEGHNA